MSGERSTLNAAVGIVTIVGVLFGIGWGIFVYLRPAKAPDLVGQTASPTATAAVSASASASVAAPESPGVVTVESPAATATEKQKSAGPLRPTKAASPQWAFTSHWSYELYDRDDSAPGYIDPAKHDALLFHGLNQPTRTDMGNQGHNLSFEAKWKQLNFPYYSDISSTSPTPDQCLGGGSDGTAQFSKGATPTYCRDMTSDNGGRKTVAFVKVKDSTNVDGSPPSVSVEIWFAYQS